MLVSLYVGIGVEKCRMASRVWPTTEDGITWGRVGDEVDRDDFDLGEK